MWDSSLVFSGTTWDVSCPRGNYVQSTTLENNGVYENNLWQTCDSSWYEWSDQGTNKCISWNKEYYLSLSTAGGVSGSCTMMSSDIATIDMFVKAEYVETSGDGSYNNPFGNIVKALSYIEEQASMYSGTTANICKNSFIINLDLLNGNHFMTRNFAHYNYK